MTNGYKFINARKSLDCNLELSKNFNTANASQSLSPRPVEHVEEPLRIRNRLFYVKKKYEPPSGRFSLFTRNSM